MDVVEIFDAAVDVPEAERETFLQRACGGDETLLRKVKALLKAHNRPSHFLDQPPARARPEGGSIAPIGETAGDQIGRYKLLQQIGEGGCGVVFMAEQEEPVLRRVALKVVKPGMDSKNVIARFEAERQALALMEHPNIAHVFDAGTTESGRPYFVMELIRGIKITDYCDQNSLTTIQRLKLFIEVCNAVQHAHQKGIIHRDIKPSNILVTTSAEGKPVPKIIDFGIAKATTGQRLTDNTVFTAFEMLIGTPAYMSPEQAALTSVDVDTRSDLYSLGVLLYELLTGTTPFDTQELLKSGLDEVRRVIQTEDPLRPSTKLSTMMAANLTLVSERRQTAPPKLIRDVRGDVDWIVIKALEKDRTRRYPTANELAMDIQRYLAGEIVLARPPSSLYKVQKLFLKHKLLVSGFGSILVVLTVLLGFTYSLLLREEKAHQDLELLVAGKNESEDLRCMRADTSARSGRWGKAVADATTILEDHPSDCGSYHRLAPLLVASGDVGSYRRLCQQMVARFADTRACGIADAMAKDCLILSSSGVGLKPVAAMAEFAVSQGQKEVGYTFFEICKALAEYRQGHNDEAVKWSQLASVNPYPYSQAEAYAILAMSQYQLGQETEARAVLAKCEDDIQRRLPKVGSRDLGQDWKDWIIGHALFTEATNLIGRPATELKSSPINK